MLKLLNPEGLILSAEMLELHESMTILTLVL
jgi:hypothetical protein